MTAGQIHSRGHRHHVGRLRREKILTPLGMKTTNISNTAFKPGNNYAFPHSKWTASAGHSFQDLDNAGRPAPSIPRSRNVQMVPAGS